MRCISPLHYVNKSFIFFGILRRKPMKQSALKTNLTTELPVAANGNSWKTSNGTTTLKSVLREWQAEFDTTPANDAAE